MTREENKAQKDINSLIHGRKSLEGKIEELEEGNKNQNRFVRFSECFPQ